MYYQRGEDALGRDRGIFFDTIQHLVPIEEAWAENGWRRAALPVVQYCFLFTSGIRYEDETIALTELMRWIYLLTLPFTFRDYSLCKTISSEPSSQMQVHSRFRHFVFLDPNSRQRSQNTSRSSREVNVTYLRMSNCSVLRL